MPPTEICITAQDDGSFTVDAETKEVEAQEQEPSGTEQTFKTKEEALAAAGQLLDASSMGPPAGTSDQELENPAENTAEAGQEEEAMMGGYRAGVTGR